LAAYVDLGFKTRLVVFKGLIVVAFLLVDDGHVLSSPGQEQFVAEKEKEKYFTPKREEKYFTTHQKASEVCEERAE
jgi:hypothetical protein